MEEIILKLEKIGNKEFKKHENVWKDWSPEEIKKLLEIYLVICQKKEYIYGLVYSLHGTDSYEDIFRDYDYRLLEDEAQGVAVALECVKENAENK